MKLSAFYYHEYPDGNVPDPEVAYSGVTAEIGGENASLSEFDAAYFFHVATIGYLKSGKFQLGKDFVALRSLIIVRRFEDAIIRAALESILDNMSSYGLFDAMDYPLDQLMGSSGSNPMET